MKCINGLEDILGISDIIFNYSKNYDIPEGKEYHLEVGYYELKDEIGSKEKEINKEYFCVKNNAELLQLALKISGAKTLSDVEKLYEEDIIVRAKIQSKYDGYKDIKHNLIITGFNPAKALQYINKNSIKNDIKIVSVYKVLEGVLSNKRIEIVDISNDVDLEKKLPRAEIRQTLRAKDSLEKAFEDIKLLNIEKNQEKRYLPVNSLQEMLQETFYIEQYLKKYINEQMPKDEIQNETEEEEEM